MSSPKKLVILCGFVFTLILFYIFFMLPFNHHHKIINSKHPLRIARYSIGWFKEQTGRYPISLEEITEYAERIHVSFYYTFYGEVKGDPNMKPLRLFLPGVHHELISSSSGNTNVYNTLNNQGGFFYDNKTGVVKLNLTKPLKKYFMFYFDSDKNEIPAEW